MTTSPHPSIDIGQILLRKDLLSTDQLAELEAGETPVRRLDRVAVERGYIPEDVALRAIAEEFGMKYVELTEIEIDLGLLDLFPQRVIHRRTLFPISRENGSLRVATSDPFDLYTLDEVAAEVGCHVEPVLAVEAEIDKLIKTHLGVGSETVQGLLDKKSEGGIELLEEIESDGSELSEMAGEASVIRLVNEILLEAIEARATDVHIETHEAGLRVRYRIDGMLQSQPVPPEINHFQAAIVSRLKIMSRLNIAERRLPQDGRIQLRASGREIDVRVSVIPMIHGEGICMRLLDKGRMEFDLRSLGMDQNMHETFSQLIRQPHGIILVTGPTGSGKTTTLYSALVEIRKETNKIITAEDPVEYQLADINQIQVHPKIGLTFGAALRSMLRHDPDVILVGEIRDLETAENAIQASLTGHLVFSTLHTNDSSSAFTRLVDMGVEPYLASSTVEAVMAQRLARTLCSECKVAYDPDPADLPDDFPYEQWKESGEPIYRAEGCRACRRIGYRGRIGLYELLIANETIRNLAHDRANSWTIQQEAVKHGLITLRQDGWKKVLDGRTAIEEVLRVAK